MNFSKFHNLGISGHQDIDFVDIKLDADVALYLDPERIAFSNHPLASAAVALIQDFFSTLYDVALEQDDWKLYHMLSFGREPNETHLGLSSACSCGRGTSPEILMPIIKNMKQAGLFERGLITQLGDLQLWTPNFGFDRLSDLTTNIIKELLYYYTVEQYKFWGIEIPNDRRVVTAVWDPSVHDWSYREFPQLISNGFHTLLVPKVFVGRSMLSTPGQLLQKYALKYRQREHLDERSPSCHRKVDRNGNEKWAPPTKKEIRAKELRGYSEKAFLLEMGQRSPQMVNELHTDHKLDRSRLPQGISDRELDELLYGYREIAV